MHMYVTSALQRTDMKAVGLQLALDLLHEKVGTSVMLRHEVSCSVTEFAYTEYGWGCQMMSIVWRISQIGASSPSTLSSLLIKWRNIFLCRSPVLSALSQSGALQWSKIMVI